MPSLREMKQDRAAAIQKAESILTLAETGNRALTAGESLEVDQATAEAQALQGRIAVVEKQETLRSAFNFEAGGIRPGAGTAVSVPQAQKVLSADYQQAFHAWIASGGQQTSAALYEGSGPSGGFTVPVTVDSQIVPLAPQETALRRLARVIPTTADIKLPRQTTFTTAAIKPESGATVNLFAESGPTLDQFTLSAFMTGVAVRVSWELAQDVPAMQAFAVNDMLVGVSTLEEQKFVSGSGNGEPQGLSGNIGAGVTESLSLDGVLDLIGSLKARYHEGASFLMNRPVSIQLRKLQRQANLFEPVFTTDAGGKDRLYGYPVEYAAAMPAATQGNTPVVFGNFSEGFVIGDRGGNGISVKILDQPLATAGQILLLAFKRTDSRVRLAEALQGYTIA